MNQPQRIISFRAGLSNFAPAAMRLVRKGPELAIEERGFVITSANIDQLVGELEEVDWPREGGPSSIETVRTSRQWIIKRTVQTSLSAQRIALFPVRITTPEAGIHWQKDVAHGLVSQSLKSLVDSPKPIPEMADDAIRRDVADVVLVSIERLADHIRVHELANVRDGILARDASLADELERIGTNGKKLAADIRKGAKKRSATPDDLLTYYKAWLPDGFLERDPVGGLPWIRALGRAAWLDVVQPRRKRDAERNPAGIVRGVNVGRLLPAMTKQLEIPSIDDGTVRDAKGNVIGRITVTTDATLEAARRGLAQLGSVAGHRLVRSLVHRAHDQHEAGTGDFRHVRYEGGFAGLLETVGLGPNYGETMREIAEAGQAIRWHASEVEGGGFWTWTHQRGARGRQGHVSFILGEVLLPGYAATMRVGGRQSYSARLARRIIPELRGEVPIPAGLSPDKHGAAWTLHRMMLVELVDHARDLATAGFASIPSSKVAELARAAGLTKPDDLARVLDAFTNGAGDVAPIFKRDGDGWTLADYHARERDYIADLGKRQATGQAGGKLAARKRIEGAPRRRRSRET